jgi:recombinational DNA repair protein (RecF pathway)
MKDKFRYRNLFVTNLIHSKDNQYILTVISEEEGKFSCSWNISNKSHISKPNLFSYIYAILHKQSDNIIKLRKYDIIFDLYHRGSNEEYLTLNLLARITNLFEQEHSYQNSSFNIWKNHLNKVTTKEKINALDIIIMFLYHHGVYSDFKYCEECNSPLTEVFIENGVFKCEKCTLFKKSIQFPQVLIEYSNGSNKINNISNHMIKNISNELLIRLEPNLKKDRIINKILSIF